MSKISFHVHFNQSASSSMQNFDGPFHVRNMLTACIIFFDLWLKLAVDELVFMKTKLILWKKRTVYFICIHVLHFINCSGDILI